MASKTSCRIDTAPNTLADIKAALNTASLITSVLYEDSAQYLIFSTPLSSKVIKIYQKTARDTQQYYYGDEWTSASTITNQVSVSYVSGNTLAAMEIITDDDFFAIFTYQNAATYCTMFYVGALDNTDELVFGLGGYSGSGANSLCRNITDTVTLTPVSGIGEINGAGLRDTSGYFLTIPMMFANAGVLEMNGANPAQAVGLKMSSVNNTATNGVAGGGAGYLLYQSSSYTNNVLATKCSVVCEYTP